MKTLLKIILLASIIYFISSYMDSKKISYRYYPPSAETVDTPPPSRKGGLRKFLAHVGRAEGLGSYTTVSDRGYLGMYQFHPKTLASIGFDVEADEFLQDPNLQDSAMVTLMKHNTRALKKIISRYEGKYVNGVYVTKSGILAGAHLVGPGGVLAFFNPTRYDYNTSDANGMTVERYMIKFANYDLRGF